LGEIEMHRIVPLVVFALLCGCDDPSANAPLLKLRVNRDNGSSVGQYRVFHTGLIAGAADGVDGGAVASQSVTINEISEEGVTVTVTVFEADAGESSKQFFVPYDKEITVSISQDATGTARLERRDARP
jgi:hypothetical protein